MRRGALRDKMGQGCLSAARRPPENARGYPILFNRDAERAIFSQQMFLSDKFIKRFGTHPVRQRSNLFACILVVLFKKRHGRCLKADEVCVQS